MKALFYMTKTRFLFLLIIIGCAPHQENASLEQSLRQHVSYLASDNLKGRATGSPEEQLAVGYISDYFEKVGVAPKGTENYFQVFKTTPSQNPHESHSAAADSSEGVLVTNVVALLDNPGEDIIIIGAHHDHLGMGDFGTLHRGDTAIHNGADDNASGVAIVMALAKTLQTKGLQNDVLFITFSGEERGLWGSNYFAKNPTIDLSKVKAMINLDMVGRLNDERKLVAHGTGTSPTWEETLNSSNTDSLALIMKTSGVGPSDHTSFYLQDIPVLHLFTGQHEDYHKPGDDTDKLNYAGMVMITHYLENIIEKVDQAQEMAFTKTKDNTENTPRFTVTLGVVPDYLFDGKGMRIDGVTEGKPASKAGIKKGDVVVAMGDSTVADMMSYMRALSVFDKGDSTTVKVNRDDETLTYDIKF